ncbi:hypothetical protein EB230_20865 [Mesorhizobium sp. NZP2234]|nr:hypothetical protein EB230_20865 [Mesorhizobium sp. NZP2234]
MTNGSLLFAGMLAVLIALNYGAYRISRDGSWHEHLSLKRRRLIDGSVSRGLLMCRRTADGWQWRSMSKTETERSYLDSISAP